MTAKLDVTAKIQQGLTGREAARLVLQNYVEWDHNRPLVMSIEEEQAVAESLSGEQRAIFQVWLSLYQTVSYTLQEARILSLEAGLEITSAVKLLTDRQFSHFMRQALYFMPAIMTKEQAEELSVTGEAPDSLYAILQDDPPDFWLDSQGYYNNLTAAILEGMASKRYFEDVPDDEQQTALTKAIEQAKSTAIDKTKRFLAVKQVLETLSQIIGVNFAEDIPGWQAVIFDNVRRFNQLLVIERMDKQLIEKMRSISGLAELPMRIPVEIKAIKYKALKPDPGALSYFTERFDQHLGKGWQYLPKTGLESEEEAPDNEQG